MAFSESPKFTRGRRTKTWRRATCPARSRRANLKKMSDDFYGDFDRACLEDDFNRPRQADYRSVFHQDRDRVMFTPAFRRLQAKTQVFQAGEYDFYRTRLTHSMEVASIAKSIVVWLRTQNPEVRIDPDLLEAICLAHDIGHPPFGHAGERVLNTLMAPTADSRAMRRRCASSPARFIAARGIAAG